VHHTALGPEVRGGAREGRIDTVVAAVQEGCAGGLGEVELALQLLRQPEIVGIAEGEVATSSHRDSGVAGRCGAAAAPAAHEPHPTVLLGELLDEARGAVRGRIVDDDQLEVPAGLIEYDVDRLTQCPRAVA